MPKVGQPNSLPRIDLFKDQTWQPSAVKDQVDTALATDSIDPLQSGTFAAGYAAEVIDRYYDSLGGKPLESFDPNGFLTKTLGMSGSKTAGRTNEDLLRAFKLNNDYKPDPKYLPLPKWLRGGVQKFLLGLNRISPKATASVDRFATKLVIYERPLDKGRVRIAASLTVNLKAKHGVLVVPFAVSR